MDNTKRSLKEQGLAKRPNAGPSLDRALGTGRGSLEKATRHGDAAHRRPLTARVSERPRSVSRPYRQRGRRLLRCDVTHRDDVRRSSRRAESAASRAAASATMWLEPRRRTRGSNPPFRRGRSHRERAALVRSNRRRPVAARAKRHGARVAVDAGRRSTGRDGRVGGRQRIVSVSGVGSSGRPWPTSGGRTPTWSVQRSDFPRVRLEARTSRSKGPLRPRALHGPSLRLIQMSAPSSPRAAVTARRSLRFESARKCTAGTRRGGNRRPARRMRAPCPPPPTAPPQLVAPDTTSRPLDPGGPASLGSSSGLGTVDHSGPPWPEPHAPSTAD